MQTNIYTLPEISFVGGQTQTLRFHLFTAAGVAFHADSVSADFSICDYSNKYGAPILSYTPSFDEDDQGVVSILAVTIPASDTVALAGKYIFQITVVDAYGNVEIPGQGFMYISRNINQDYILDS